MPRFSLLAFCAFSLPCLALPAAAADTPIDFEKQVRPVVTKYCLTCHNKDKKKGGFDLTKTVGTPLGPGAVEAWEQAALRARAKEMPPPEHNLQPTPQERELLQAWAQIARKQADDCKTLATDQTQRFYKGHVMSRRLNRAEYNNTVRDLVGLDLRPADRFPSDGAGGEGFDNNGDALFTSPIHIEKYLDAADFVLGIVLDKDGPARTKLPAADVAKARAKLLIAAPGKDVSPRDAARTVVKAFAARAFRRPVTDAEVDRFLSVFDRATQRGDSFEDAVKLPLKAVLISPHFLFLVEPEPEKEGVTPLGGFPLAARLSYFLWASMPDEELFQLAAQDRLKDDAVLRQQVRRMLKDPRTRGLAESFTQQWLGLRALGETVRPDRRRFPEFDTRLADAMREEAVLVFDRILREDRSLLELIDCDYTFANERLAKIYGVEGVKGDELRLVKLTDRTRGGVLGMAGVLTVTSYPLRTSPVLRGKWVLEDVLGAKVPPPPAGVNELPADDRNTKGLTFRKQLEQHRTKPECASCHQRMDPLGFGLENFDPIGRYRKEQNGLPIDAAGELPSGEKFSGPAELKEVLLARKEEFLRNLSRKVLGFALGRQLYSFDQCVIDDSLKALAADEYKSSALIEKVVLSYPFRHRYVKK